ncbi:MAG: hypothetical protein FWC65_05730, partial [Treponema sp.]|nr:hypothetical protein [Treponema sp.]
PLYLPAPPRNAADQAAPEGVFTVAVAPGDSARYLGLSSAAWQGDHLDGGRRKVELCVAARGEETVLAVSSPFSLPRLREMGLGETKLFAEQNPAVALSGYGEFLVARSGERILRRRRSVAPS